MCLCLFWLLPFNSAVIIIFLKHCYAAFPPNQGLKDEPSKAPSK